MATRRQSPNAAAAGDDPPAAAGRDGSIEQALARSREIRKNGDRQIHAARERTASVRRPGPVARDPAAGPTGAAEEIERTKQARARLAAVAGELAQTEEAVARIHEELAGRDSQRAAQYLRAAEDARQAARRAREIQRDTSRDLAVIRPTRCLEGPFAQQVNLPVRRLLDVADCRRVTVSSQR